MSEKHVPKEGLVAPPCRVTCPAGVDVPRYIRRIKEGRFDEALAVIRERIPFPFVCGYACYSPCETSCVNRQFGEAVAIRALKRTAAEKGGDLWQRNLTIQPETGKRVAIVGSGPSGLTAAYYMVTLGHKVTVLEALDQPGGMLRVGIPGYRLPRGILNKEIDQLKKIGIEIKTGHRVESVEHLLNDGYDVVYIACGAHQGAKLGIPGDELPGMLDGISFLRQLNQGKTVEMGDRVVVIGGGNTAIDSARSAVRLGAKEVSVMYRRSDAEITAFTEEVGAADLEGVKLNYLTLPIDAKEKNGAMEVTFTRMALGELDKSGRPTPVPIAGSEYTWEVDQVIVAIGQKPVGTRSLGVPLSKGDFIRTDDTSLSTGKPGVFAGGDIVTGPMSIIHAIAHGRIASVSMDKFLGGSGDIDQELASPEEVVIITEYTIKDLMRQTMPCLPLANRTCSFDAVELGLPEKEAIIEAGRCRSCDAREFNVTLYGQGCKECSYCIEVCAPGVFEPADYFNEKGYRPMAVKHTEKCVGCLACYYACPDFSIEVEALA